MRTRSLGLLALAVVAAVAAAWWLLAAQSNAPVTANGPAIPGFDAQQDAVDRIDVIGAGGETLVGIVRRDGQWRMPSKQDWPANQREVSQALFRLGQARSVETKTANPALHARLGVEDVQSAQAKGAQLWLSGTGVDVRVTVGNNHPALGGSFVRIGDAPQTWLLDADIAPARNPVDWLDRRLLDLPMARVEQIRVTPAAGRAFTLSRRDDRFSLDGLPPTAMATLDIGNATAGFTDQLAFDDVAADNGTPAEQTFVVETVDGLQVRVEAWRQDEGTWARISVVLDAARAEAWLARAKAAEPQQAPTAEASDAAAAVDAANAAGAAAAAVAAPLPDVAALAAQAAEWQARFQGHRFLLPAHKVEVLMRSRDEYLAGAP